MYVPGSQAKDFGAKNVALIALFAVILGSLAWSQRPSRSVSVANGLSFNKQNTNVFAQGADANQSAVLGATTVNQDLLNQFATIPVKTSSDTSKAALQAYADQIAVIQRADAGHAKIVDDLNALAAPEVLADYHRLQLAFYNLKYNAALNGIDAQTAQTLQQSASSQLDAFRASFQKSAGITLP